MQTKAKATERINARISPDIKARAQAELAKNGLTISEYMRIVLTDVAKDGLPRYFGQPSAELTASIKEMIDVFNGERLPDHSVSSVAELNRDLDS